MKPSRRSFFETPTYKLSSILVDEGEHITTGDSDDDEV
jgi:hypothetical protein